MQQAADVPLGMRAACFIVRRMLQPFKLPYFFQTILVGVIE